MPGVWIKAFYTKNAPKSLIFQTIVHNLHNYPYFNRKSLRFKEIGAYPVRLPFLQREE